jgi:hypothetical protein
MFPGQIRNSPANKFVIPTGAQRSGEICGFLSVLTQTLSVIGRVQSTFAKAYSGFPVEFPGVGAFHATFLNESRTRSRSRCPVQEIRIRGPKTMGAAQRSLLLSRKSAGKHPRPRRLDRQINSTVHLRISPQRTAQQLRLHTLIPLLKNLPGCLPKHRVHPHAAA